MYYAIGVKLKLNWCILAVPVNTEARKTDNHEDMRMNERYEMNYT